MKMCFRNDEAVRNEEIGFRSTFAKETHLSLRGTWIPTFCHSSLFFPFSFQEPSVSFGHVVFATIRDYSWMFATIRDYSYYSLFGFSRDPYFGCLLVIAKLSSHPDRESRRVQSLSQELYHFVKLTREFYTFFFNRKARLYSQ